MSPDEQPAVVAYDGSDEAQAAVREAARLLPGRRLVVVSVWEQGLALMLMPPTDTISGVPNMTPSPETIATTDRAQHDHASETAAQGAEIARSLAPRPSPIRWPTTSTPPRRSPPRPNASTPRSS